MTIRMRRRSCRLTVAAIALGGLLAVGGCAIPKDGAPRDIPNDNGAALNGQPTTPNQSGGTSDAKVYFLATEASSTNERLQPASRPVPREPAELLQQLLDGLTKAEQAKRWRTAIPAGTRLLSARLVGGGVLDVDLSQQFFKTAGEAQTKAVAQIVFTGAGVPSVVAVRIKIEGVEREWPREDGSLTDLLTPFAFPDLDPTSQPDLPPIPSPTTPTTIGPATTRPLATTTTSTTVA